MSVDPVHVAPHGSVTEVPEALAGPVLPPIERVQHLDVKPGDVLMVTVPQCDARQAALIKERFGEIFARQRIIVLSGGIEVTVADGDAS